jgi:glycosyltransferase involved in cell wall biosynthesis
MNIPSYTIGIPVYERIFGFEDALQSALNVAGCTNILIVDDNSSHNQFENISHSFNDNRIHYVRNSENIGLFGNWNKCIQLAETDYISILCSDDLIETNAFVLFLNVHKENCNIDVFFGSFTTFNKSKDDSIVHREFRNGIMSGVDLLTDAINNGPCFPVLSIMNRTTMLKYPFVSKPHSGNDWLWIYSNAMSLNLYATNQTINYWRRHPNQDAVLSQSITMDCWPLMYKLMSIQLQPKFKSLSNKAMRRAKGVILSWLINGYKGEKTWHKRLLNGKNEQNIFVDTMLDIVNEDWLLSMLIRDQNCNYFLYNLGRLLRKIGYYPAS